VQYQPAEQLPSIYMYTLTQSQIVNVKSSSFITMQ